MINVFKKKNYDFVLGNSNPCNFIYVFLINFFLLREKNWKTNN